MNMRNGGAGPRVMESLISKPHFPAMYAPSFRIVLSMFAILSTSPLDAAKEAPAMSLPGYKAVPVHYGALNKMLMSASINGHPANLIVDTGANQSILDSSAAESFGVSPSRHGLRYLGFTQINGQLFPLGFVRSFTAGPMNFGGTSVALLNASTHNSFSTGSGLGDAHVDGVLGTDILTRHKAVINSRTRLIFLRVDSSRQLQLAKFALSQRFTRVPLRKEENGAFTVPCSINNRLGSLLVDTGAFVTTFNESALKSLGVTLQPTQAKARFTNGLVRQISLGQVNYLTVGDFKVPPTKLAAAVLPNFVLQQGSTRVDGILGLELLVMCHGIIDFDSMSLFLK
jgi:predicted aspartyl protease